MGSSNLYLGIDYGTCNSSMAWVNPKTGKAEIVKNAEGEERTPSLVFFGEDKTILVGKPAEECLNDERRIGGLSLNGTKRHIGKKMVFLLGNRKITPTDIAVRVIRKLRKDAQDYLYHQEVTRAVITVPATFTQLEKDQVKLAGQRAGFQLVELLDEPMAAALAYKNDGYDVGRRVLVYDLGAGTFDLALLDFQGDGFEPVLPPCGLRKGGDDFDLALYGYVRHLARREGREVDLDGKLNQRLLMGCRSRKENLSFRAIVPCSDLLPDGKPFRYDLKRNTFEKLIHDIVIATVSQTEKYLHDSRKGGYQIDTIVLVGGSSRVPLVSSMLADKLPIKPEKWQNQDVAVALGAAYYASALWAENGTLPSSSTLDQEIVEKEKKVQHNNDTPYCPECRRSNQWDGKRCARCGFQLTSAPAQPSTLAKAPASLQYEPSIPEVMPASPSQPSTLAKASASLQQEASVPEALPASPSSTATDDITPIGIDWGGVLGGICGFIIGCIHFGFWGGVGLLLVGCIVGALMGGGIAWVVRQVDPSQRGENEWTWIIVGYLCPVVALVSCPPLFGIAGFVIGIRNISHRIFHGGWQVGLSIICGLLGMLIIGLLLLAD